MFSYPLRVTVFATITATKVMLYYDIVVVVA